MKMGEYDPFQYLVRKKYELNFVLAGSFLAWISKKWWMLNKIEISISWIGVFFSLTEKTEFTGNFVFNHKQGLTERRTRCAKAICYKNRSLWGIEMGEYDPFQYLVRKQKLRVKFCFSRIIFGLNKQKMMDALNKIEISISWIGVFFSLTEKTEFTR